jgi:hypothetical protein
VRPIHTHDKPFKKQKRLRATTAGPTTKLPPSGSPPGRRRRRDHHQDMPLPPTQQHQDMSRQPSRERKGRRASSPSTVREGKGGRPATTPSPGEHPAGEGGEGASVQPESEERARGGRTSPHRAPMCRGYTSTVGSTSAIGSRRGSTRTAGCVVAGDEGRRAPWGGGRTGGDGQIRHPPTGHQQCRRRHELKVPPPRASDLEREGGPAAAPAHRIWREGGRGGGGGMRVEGGWQRDERGGGLVAR